MPKTIEIYDSVNNKWTKTRTIGETLTSEDRQYIRNLEQSSSVLNIQYRITVLPVSAEAI